MNTQTKPQQVKKCTEKGCGQVFQVAGDVPIRLIKPVRVPMAGTPAAEGRCPLHGSQGGGDE